MPDISKSVEATITVPKISGLPQISDLAAQTMKAGKTTKELNLELEKTPSIMGRSGSTARKGFQDIGDGADQAKRKVKELNAEMEKTGKGGGMAGSLGLSERQFKQLGKMGGWGRGLGMGRLAMAGGGIGGAIMGAGMFGKSVWNKYEHENQSFGEATIRTLATPATYFMGLAGNKEQGDKDRSASWMQTERAIAMQMETEHAKAGMAGQILEAGLHTYATGTPEQQMAARLKGLDARQKAHESLGFKGSDIRGQGEDMLAKAERDIPLLKKRAGRIGASETDRDQLAQAERNRLTAQTQILQGLQMERRESEAILGIEKERGEAKKQQLQMTGASIKSKASQLGGLDAVSQRQAIDLARKLKSGAEMTPEELELAGSGPMAGLLQPLLSDRRAKEAEGSGALGSLLEASGTDEEKRVAGAAREKGVTMEAVIRLDEEQIAAAVKRAFEQMGGLVKDVIIDAQAKVKNDMDRDKAAREQAHAKG